MIKKQYLEAERRIKQLGLHENVMKDFEKGVLNKSETTIFPGVLYWLDDEEKDFINKWAKKSGNLPYHIIKQNTDFGPMMSVLYVSKHEDEWEIDRIDLWQEQALAYCIIGFNEMYGEYGSIGVRPANGGLKRTW